MEYYYCSAFRIEIISVADYAVYVIYIYIYILVFILIFVHTACAQKIKSQCAYYLI
jgi:hypothetical protein